MNNEIKIEKGIPIPKSRVGSTKYPFKEMKVGDSFLVEERLRSCMAMQAKKHGIAVTTARTDDGKVRVWRVK